MCKPGACVMDIFKDMSGMTTVDFWSFLAWQKGQPKPLGWMEAGVMVDLSGFSISS